jgi:hypothetical protein
MKVRRTGGAEKLMLEQERHKREEFQQMKVRRRSRSSCWSRRNTREGSSSR